VRLPPNDTILNKKSLPVLFKGRTGRQTLGKEGAQRKEAFYLRRNSRPPKPSSNRVAGSGIIVNLILSIVGL
jgi:hypothetical protein